MKHLPLKVIFICVLLPPLLYIVTIQGMEALIQKNWKTDLHANLITNTEALLQGKKDVRAEIERNINHFLKSSTAVYLGAKPDIVVKTESGKQIYPEYSYKSDFSLSLEDSFSQVDNFESRDKLAKYNFKILNQDLKIHTNVHIQRNSVLAYTVLIFYILVFSTILIVSYRSNVKQAENILNQRYQDMLKYQKQMEDAQARLEDTYERENEYQEQINNLRQELKDTDHKLQSTEESALTEIEKMEEKLQENIAARKEREEEIENLKQEISKFEQNNKKQKNKQDKKHDQILKRFNTLYKNVAFHDRAVEGFLELTPEMQLKAEEMIHTLDQDHNQIKTSKVFSGKNTITTLKSEFAYKGRIYWKVDPYGKPQILNIGTKNTQQKDLAYLEKLEE